VEEIKLAATVMVMRVLGLGGCGGKKLSQSGFLSTYANLEPVNPTFMRHVAYSSRCLSVVRLAWRLDNQQDYRP
jgi:hypothetical protein